MNENNDILKTEQIEFRYIDDDDYVYKSNNLVESSYKLSINAQRMVYMAAKKLKPIYITSNIKPSQLDTLAAALKFGDIEITVSEFKKRYNLKGNYLYENLKSVADELMEAQIHYWDSDKGTFIKKNWMSQCEYNPNGKSVVLSFNSRLILDLMVFKRRYSKLIDITTLFKSSYHIRIYELAKKHLKFGEWSIGLSEFRYKLSIPDDLYPQYTKLKAGIIKQAVKAINEKSDIEIYELSELRGRNRKVNHLTFKIRPNTNKNIKNLLSSNEDEVCESEPTVVEKVSNIVKIPLTAGQVDIIVDITLAAIELHKVDMYPLEYIEDKVKVVEMYSMSKKIDNYFGILISALKENWQFIGKESTGRPSSFNNFEGRGYTNDYYKFIEDNLVNNY